MSFYVGVECNGFKCTFVNKVIVIISKNTLKISIALEMSTHSDAWKSPRKALTGALKVNDIRSECHCRGKIDINSSLIHSECSLLQTRFLADEKQAMAGGKSRAGRMRVVMPRCPRRSLRQSSRRMKRVAIVMSSSSSDDDETEATERRKFKKREKGKVP